MSAFFKGNYGQMYSPANASKPSGSNASNGTNGCSYPTQVPTLFNQLNAAKKTCAANNPDTNPTNMQGNFAAGVTTYTSAQPNGQ